MATFLHQNRPLVTGMILKETADEARFAVKNAIYDGADALGIQLERLLPAERTPESYQKIFAAAGGRPIYITSYRNSHSEGLSDAACMDNLLTGLRCGGTLADVMGDTFCRSDMEITYNPEAVARQKDLIAEIHGMGREVLMSSHVLRYLPAEEVLKIALAQQSRGADIVKIVTAADSQAQQLENLRITALLQETLEVPFLFLSGGTHSKIHRMVGPMLGCFTYLAVSRHDACAVPSQPTIAAARAVRDNLDNLPDIADVLA